MANYSLQLLHAADMEGGGGDLLNAPAFVSIVDYLEDQHSNSLFISSGDLVLPGPYLSAAGDRSLRDAVQQANEQMLGLAPGSLSNLREGIGRIDITLANLLDPASITLGNHEFDQGTSTLADMLEADIRGETLDDVRWLGAQFPYLSANLDFSADSNLSGLYTADILADSAFDSTTDDLSTAAAAPKLAPATIVERGGEKIGIVGATTQILDSISSNGDTRIIGTDQNDILLLAAQLQVYIDQLRDQGVNKIIVASHLQQIQLEEQLAGLLDGVDIIMAGGSNALLADADQPLFAGGNTAAYSDYPILTQDKSGNNVALINTDGGWRYVGQLTVEFDDQGQLIAESINDQSSRLYAATDSQLASLWGSTDAAYAQGSKGQIAQDLVNAVAGVVTEKDGLVFGNTDTFLQGERSQVRTEETNLGNLTADANLWYAQQYDASVSVSIKNGGGIREPIGVTYAVGAEGDYELRPPQANPESGKETGQISQLDIESSLRFNNSLTLLTLTRAELVQVLEHAVAASAEGATPGQFAQVSGIEYSYDWNQPAGARITSAARVDSSGQVIDVLVSQGDLVGDGSAEVRIVTLGFLASGGDSYPFADFEASHGDRVNRLDLDSQDAVTRTADAASPGTEQDALAEFLQERFSDSDSAYSQADTPATDDQRIQNLALRDDSVLAADTQSIIRLYDTLFNRDGDMGGLAYWHNTMEAGLSYHAIVGAFVESAEYQQHFGSLADDPGALVEQLYQYALNREADAGGKAFYTELVEQGQLIEVISSISESAEHISVLG